MCNDEPRSSIYVRVLRRESVRTAVIDGGKCITVLKIADTTHPQRVQSALSDRMHWAMRCPAASNDGTYRAVPHVCGFWISIVAGRYSLIIPSVFTRKSPNLCFCLRSSATIRSSWSSESRRSSSIGFSPLIGVIVLKITPSASLLSFQKLRMPSISRKFIAFSTEWMKTGKSFVALACSRFFTMRRKRPRLRRTASCVFSSSPSTETKWVVRGRRISGVVPEVTIQVAGMIGAKRSKSRGRTYGSPPTSTEMK